MRRTMLAASMSLTLCALAPAMLRAQVTRGVVIDATTRAPVAEATVTVLDTAARELGRARTDSAGRFTINVTVPAPYIVVVRRLGFHAYTTDDIVLGARDTTLSVVLTPSPLPLPASVTRARAPGGREWGRDAFMRRRELGRGVFLTNFDVLASEPLYLEDAFRDVDGLQVVGAGQGSQVRSLRGRRCMRTFINRLPTRIGLDLLPKHVLGIEIYREFDEVPEEMRMDAHPCGLINVWTRAAWAPRPKKGAPPANTPRG